MGIKRLVGGNPPAKKGWVGWRRGPLFLGAPGDPLERPPSVLPVNLTHAYPKLAPYRPPGRLLSPPLLLSILFNVALSVLLQLFGFLYVKRQAWYLQLRGHW